MPERGKIAIIAALEQELWPLIKHWSRKKFAYDGREFSCYESDYAVVICSGIGFEYGRRAAEAIIAQYSPEILISAGIAGAAIPDLHVGDTVFPAIVVDPHDGSRHETAIGNAALSKTPLARTVLASSAAIAGVEEKRRLAKSYGAQLIDMEGAAVARAAQAHNLPFLAIKTVSDEADVDLHELNLFVRNGQFVISSFVFYLLLRPWLWLKMIRLGRNTKVAAENLCAWLRESALTNTIVPGVTSPSKS
jgi:adenosylhomocysteine nucleosidase